MLSNLLIYRFLVFNLLVFSFAGAAVWNGTATPIYATDASRITVLITALFAIGWAGTAYETWRIGRGLNDAKRNGPMAGSGTDRDKVLAKLAWLDDIANWLVSLGLLGTVIGFWMALPDGTVSMDAKGAQSAVGGLMVGMRTALGTTILGAILAIWHEVNLRLLNTGVVVLWQDRMTQAELRRLLK